MEMSGLRISGYFALEREVVFKKCRSGHSPDARTASIYYDVVSHEHQRDGQDVQILSHFEIPKTLKRQNHPADGQWARLG